MPKQLWTLGAALVAALTIVGAASAAGTAPDNTAPPTINGSMRAGETLTASVGTWNGTQPISYAYQWQTCDKNGAGCNAINGATSSSYAVASADVGSTLRVRVTASNGAGSSSATSVPTAVVAARAIGNLTLQADHRLRLYGQSITLSGTAEGADAGTQVTIRGYRPGSTALFPVADTKTSADGSFSVTFRPAQRTVYIAKVGTQTSAPVPVNVRPKVVVHHLAGHWLRVNVLAARSLVGRYVVLQRWSKANQVWVSVQRVYLRAAVPTSGSTVVSTALTRLRLGGVMTRVFVPLGQARPGYVSSTSGAFTL